MIVLLIAIVSTIGALVSGIAAVALIGKWAVDTGRGRPPCSPSRLDLYTAGCVADELKIGIDLERKAPYMSDDIDKSIRDSEEAIRDADIYIEDAKSRGFLVD